MLKLLQWRWLAMVMVSGLLCGQWLHQAQAQAPSVAMQVQALYNGPRSSVSLFLRLITVNVLS